jgi:hypothetical protein
MAWPAVAGAGIGAAASLLGSSGGESTTAKLPRHLRHLGRKVLTPNAESFANEYGQGQGLYTGNRLGEQSGLVGDGEQQALDAAGIIGGMTGQSNEALEGFLNYDPNSQQNQAARDALGANVSSLFNESIRPGIENRSTMSGQFGGPQSAVALGSATAPLSRAIADSEVGLMNADRNRALQALGMSGQIQNQNLLPSAITSAAGEQQTQRNQMTLNDLIQMSESERNNALQGNQEAIGLLTQLQGGQGSVTQEGTQGNPVQGALGGALLASNLFGGGSQAGALNQGQGGIGAQPWAQMNSNQFESYLGG